MRGRALFWLLLPLLVVALVLQARRLDRLLTAQRILKAAEAVTQQLAASGRLTPSLLWHGVHRLEEAARLEPAEAAHPLARGSHYLLLRRPEEAVAAYREALGLESRPETWLNLGRAQEMAGNPEAAQDSFVTAVKLDPRLRREVPRKYRRALPRGRDLVE